MMHHEHECISYTMQCQKHACMHDACMAYIISIDRCTVKLTPELSKQVCALHDVSAIILVFISKVVCDSIFAIDIIMIKSLKYGKLHFAQFLIHSRGFHDCRSNFVQCLIGDVV